MPKVGVCLSGCGVKDGTEIHEAVATLLALDRAGAEILCLAPDVAQSKVVNHLSNAEGKESRNVLVEASRIARGQITDIKKIKSSQIDALIFPGGYGAVINLCDFASKGAGCTVHPEVERLIKEMHGAGKPIGAICISPALVARVLGSAGLRLTIGTDKGTASALEKMGAKHVDCPVTEIVVDEKNRVVSTPAYMLATRVSQVAEGVEKLVRKIMELVGSRK